MTEERDMLTRELCEPNLRSRDKKGVLEEIAGIFKRHPLMKDMAEESIVKALWEREEMGSTGFGNRVAIPHCRLSGLSEFVLGLGVSTRGAGFDAIDGRRVHLFCFLAGPREKPSEYVKVLARISRVLRSETARRELMKAPTSLALYESFLRHAHLEGGAQQAVNQKLLMLVLQEEDMVSQVMEVFVDMGIRGASVIESHGMGKILTNVPLFASFMNFLGVHEEEHNTIFALVPQNQVDRLIRAVEEVTGDMDRHAGVMALVLDVAMVKGSLQSAF